MRPRMGGPDRPPFHHVKARSLTRCDRVTHAYTIQVDPNQPLTVNNGGPNLSPGFAGQAYTALFFVIGGAAPYTWSLVSGQFPPGLSLA